MDAGKIATDVGLTGGFLGPVREGWRAAAWLSYRLRDVAWIRCVRRYLPVGQFPRLDRVPGEVRQPLDRALAGPTLEPGRRVVTHTRKGEREGDQASPPGRGWLAPWPGD